MSEERVIYQNHKESNLTRSLLSFILAIMLMIMGWIGVNVAESRVDIARIQVQLVVANDNNARQNIEIAQNKKDVITNQNGLTEVTTKLASMNTKIDNHIRYHK